MSHSTPSGPLRIGDVFEEEFQIMELLGEGGYGCVYRAAQSYTSRDVAIKITKDRGGDDREVHERTLREAKILGTLGSHKNIVQVFTARFSSKGRFYIVMELLEGKDLGRHLKINGPFQIREGLILLEKLADAMSYAHERKVVHRDIKPANIFIPEEGEPRILDFGVAKVTDFGGFRTQANQLIGTTLYLSPEQVRNQPATFRSDLYSLGLVAFQIFHRQHPLLLAEPQVDRLNLKAICDLHVRTPAPRLDHVIEGFPEYIAKIVKKLVSKEPSQRYDSAAELREALFSARLKYEAEQEFHAAHRTSYTPVSGEERVLRRSSNPEPRNSAEPEGGAAPGQSHEGPHTAPMAKRSTKKLFGPGQNNNNLPNIPVATVTRAEPAPHLDSLPPGTPPSVSRTKTTPGQHSERGQRWKARWAFTPAQILWTTVICVGAIGGFMAGLMAPWSEEEPTLGPDEVVIESSTPLPARTDGAEPNNRPTRIVEATGGPAEAAVGEGIPVSEGTQPPPEAANRAPSMEKSADPSQAQPVSQQTAPVKPVATATQATSNPPRNTATRAKKATAEPEKSEIEKLIETGSWAK